MKYSCSICRRTIDTVFVGGAEQSGISYDILLCTTCHVGKTTPIPSASELSEAYEAGHYRGESGKRFNPLVESFVHLCRIKRKKRIERYIRTGRILDIGCGRGLFLHVMQGHGWEVTGVEFNRKTAENLSRTYSIPVVHGDMAEWNFPDASFDVVTMYHVLEHLQNPLETIRKCSSLLRRGGLMVVSVPNIYGVQATFGKRHWFHLDPPLHLHHFSEEGLANILRGASFRIERTRRFDMEHNPFGWLQTLLNRTGIRKNLLYDLLKDPIIRANTFSGASNIDLASTFVALPFFLPASIILSVLESFLWKRSGTIECYAVKLP